MFVYLLQHTSEPRFKIGKANDIYQRILGIGGLDVFNLPSSFCVQASDEGSAYRLEKILHRMFEPWNLPVDEGARYTGDTEQFSMECFDRVLKFLTDNADLNDGALPVPLPPAPLRPTPVKNIFSIGDRIQRNEKRRQRAIVKERENLEGYRAGIRILESSIFSLLEMGLDEFKLCNGFVLIETGNREKYDKAHNLIDELISVGVCRRNCIYFSFVCSASGQWNDTREPKGIINFHLTHSESDFMNDVVYNEVRAAWDELDIDCVRILGLIPISQFMHEKPLEVGTYSIFL